ncbi:ExbD/TolR family protein, partial [Klebsiella variicola]|uniref:ExbD/TolR family protein n=1 Tax=Klebsiella variicola TaxID=244366 RepID=UPI0027316BB5
VSAPLITTGLVDLPSVGKSRQQPEHVIQVIFGTDEKLKIKVDQLERESIPVNRLAERVKKAHGQDATSTVVISADKAFKYEAFVQV